MPSVAAAAWPLEDPGSVLVGYGEAYERAGESATHRGVDIAAQAGSLVLAPEDGRVTFAGLVPGSEGRILAVTIETADGLLVTCSPLETADVAAGQSVLSADALGVLAAGGDASATESHLHVSVRRGDAYLDPTGVIGSAPVGDSGETSPAPDSQSAEVPTAERVVVEACQSPAAEASPPEMDDSLSGTLVPETRADSVRSLDSPVDPVAVPAGTAHGGESARTTVEVPAPTSEVPVAPGSVAVARHLGIMGAKPDEVAVAARKSNGFADPRSTPSALLVMAGVLAGAVGLWPLWGSVVRPGFPHGVRPILDDVAAAVGR